MSPLFLLAACLSLAIAITGVDSVTLKEARADPGTYIHYDEAPFNIGMHCGISLVVCYALLCAIWLTIMGVIYSTGGKKMRRQTS